MDRVGARRKLGLRPDQFVVCSFGILAPTKLNHRLLDAWLDSPLAGDENCLLVFVGKGDQSKYCRELLRRIRESGAAQQIRVTGWADQESFRAHLAAADVGVQLRTLSRGETSGTVLDCLNYGLATIVNAHGSLADFPPEGVWKLPDQFADAELRDALETLWCDASRRSRLAARGRDLILSRHDPEACAAQYHEVIEAIYRRAATGRHALVKAIAAVDDPPAEDTALVRAAKSIATTCLPSPLPRQLLVDVSGSMAHGEEKNEIERASSVNLPELLKTPPEGFRVELVYLTDRGGEWHCRYARSYTYMLLGVEPGNLHDAPIDLGPDDVFFTLDFSPGSAIETARVQLLSQWESAGLSIRHGLNAVSRDTFL